MLENDFTSGSGDTGRTFTDETVSVSQPSNPNATTEVPAQSTTISTEELFALERRMQLERPENVELPGGGTLADLQARRVETQRAESKADDETNMRRMVEQSSANLPAEQIVTTTDDGRFISAPVAEAPAEPTSEKAAREAVATNRTI